MSSSSLVWGLDTSSSVDSSAKKKGQVQRVKYAVMMCWKKRKKICTHKLITMRMRGMGGVLPELWTVASSLGPTTASPSGSSSSTSPTISLSFACLADVRMLWMGKNRTKINTRAAKDSQLCEMEPLCIILRWHTLFLKTQDDHWDNVHAWLQLWKKMDIFLLSRKFFEVLRGAKLVELTAEDIKKCSALNSAPQ